MIHALVVWALSFPKLNCSSLIIKLKLKELLFEKRFFIKIKKILILKKIFSRGLFSSPNSKRYLFFPPLPGGGEMARIYTPGLIWNFCYINNLWTTITCQQRLLFFVPKMVIVYKYSFIHRFKIIYGYWLFGCLTPHRVFQNDDDS